MAKMPEQWAARAPGEWNFLWAAGRASQEATTNRFRSLS